MIPKHFLILGATSDISIALARKLLIERKSVTLAGRDMDRLTTIKSDFEIRYQTIVETVYFDALDFNSHKTFYMQLPHKPDVVICVFGLLGDQLEAQSNWELCSAILNSNYNGAISILNVVANDFERRKEGVIVGISSVAGDRGRQSNYLYGSAKAGFTTYLSGLRNRLFSSRVHVMTVKPGFMKTNMIVGLKTPAPLTALPSVVADKIYKGIINKKDTLYVLPVWRFIMLIILSIPEVIFKRLKL